MKRNTEKGGQRNRKMGGQKDKVWPGSTRDREMRAAAAILNELHESRDSGRARERERAREGAEKSKRLDLGEWNSI